MSSQNRLIAARYVRALFELATEGKQHDNVKADMLMLKSIVEGSSEFQKLLTSPVISRKNAEKAVAKVLEATKTCELTRKFFSLLARNRRLSLTSFAIEEYLKLLAESRGELTVHVTSAQPLSADEMKTLSQSVAKSTGKKVEVKAQENPALLGGIQVRIGSKMLDNSVSGKLARLRQKLTEAA